MKRIFAFLIGISFLTIISIINITSVDKVLSEVVNLKVITTAIADGECPDDEQEDERECYEWCPEIQKMEFGDEIVCIKGSTDCTPVDCDAECP